MKKSSARTVKFKRWLVRTFGKEVRLVGTIENWDFTFGGAGNQWTTIDGERYATYWDVFTKDWEVGDLVEYTVFYAPLRQWCEWQAKDIKKVQ